MVTEEIHLNPYLEERGMRVVETDLGEYIVQLAGESPSHILAPANHKNRRQIGRLFAEKLGVEYSDDPTVLNGIALGEAQEGISQGRRRYFGGKLCCSGFRKHLHVYE